MKKYFEVMFWQDAEIMRIVEISEVENIETFPWVMQFLVNKTKA